MDLTFLVFVFLTAVLFFGSRGYKFREWNDEALSLEQTKMLQGFCALVIAFHHMSQKTCAPWNPPNVNVDGINIFLYAGYLLVGVFFFCSGFGLFKSYKTKENYLKGFIVRRVIPIFAAFVLSEIIFIVIRFFLGEKMTFDKIWKYVIGINLSNNNGWFVLVLPLFYIFFWIGFRFFKNEKVKVIVTCVLGLLFFALGIMFINKDFWSQAYLQFPFYKKAAALKFNWPDEWWHCSTLLFFVGIVFAQYEEKIVWLLKKIYWVMLPISIALCAYFHFLGKKHNDMMYNPEVNKTLGQVFMRHGELLVFKNLACLFFVLVCILLLMKIRIGNPFLKFMGTITMEFYLMHGMFVEFFGFDFFNTLHSIYWVKNVPLYVLLVIACSIPVALLFKLMLMPVNMLCGKKKKL